MQILHVLRSEAIYTLQLIFFVSHKMQDSCVPTERNLHITDKQHLPAAAQSGAAEIAVQSDCRTAKLFDGVATTTTSGKSFVPSLVCDNSGANLVMWGMNIIIRLRPAPHVLEIRSKHFLGHHETCGYLRYP